jgi:hypothetical protein
MASASLLANDSQMTLKSHSESYRTRVFYSIRSSMSLLVSTLHPPVGLEAFTFQGLLSCRNPPGVIFQYFAIYPGTR